MRILMLGWEYPPLITGGLATATEGIVAGLLALGHEVILVLPYFPFRISIPGLHIISPEQPELALSSISTPDETGSQDRKFPFKNKENLLDASAFFGKINWDSHYEASDGDFETKLSFSDDGRKLVKEKILSQHRKFADYSALGELPAPLFETLDEKMYAVGLLAAWAAESLNVDVVHAHDWMSFTALEMLRVLHVKCPLIAHIHSTEFDRSGGKNKNIVEIEKRGLAVADLVVCVSQYSRTVVIRNYGIGTGKIEVAHNAVSDEFAEPLTVTSAETTPDPVVTFIGRITCQKGPAYFVQAADIVLKTNPRVKFRVAGKGDLLPSMRQYVWELGIDKSFIFDGFLTPTEVREVLASSDVFVMPSVSEPFGIVALEAVRQNIPVILSKQSGVMEVLPNALRVDFWDTELLADRILSLLRYPHVRGELVRHATRDVQRRTWVQTAERLQEIYAHAQRRGGE